LKHKTKKKNIEMKEKETKVIKHPNNSCLKFASPIGGNAAYHGFWELDDFMMGLGAKSTNQISQYF